MLLPNLPFEKKTITIGINLIITSMLIDPHMVVIHVQIGKNIVEDILLDERSNVNIMMEELWKRLGLPDPKPTLYTF
jgi:hypothetical protein